ncbi:MAG: YczE/YyaS/YitT family protein [Spirochaetaceae bacterium]
MVRADVGLGPWDVLHQGLSVLWGIRLGTVVIGVGILLLLLWIPLKERPGIGTVFNAVMIGLAVDLLMPWIATPGHPALALLQMGVGVVVIGVGSGLYLTAEMGAGPRDGLMMGLARVTGLSIRVIRTLIELTVLLGGRLLGGSIGVGTVAFAFGIGPVIQATLALIARTGDLVKK